MPGNVTGCPLSAPESAPALALLRNHIVGNGHRAQRYARMNPPGRDAKYITVAAPLTDDQLRDHLAGRSTYAAYIIGSDGLVSVLCVELDQDGIEGGQRVLAAGQRLGVVMFSIAVKGAGNHDGSHSWALLAERVSPAAAAHLARQIAIEAGYPNAEIRPTEAAIRLPGGIHTHTGKRGRLILQSGETFDLDQPDQLSMGLAAVGALPLNAAPAEPPAPVVERPARTVKPSGDARQGESVIDAFNRRYSMAEVLELCGGKKTRDGWSCNCGFLHSHKTNLLITDRDLLLAYTPNCSWAPERSKGARAQTRFGLYLTALHGGNMKAAVKAAAQLLGMQPAPRAQQTRQEAPRHTPEQAAAYNATRTAQRQAERRAHLDQLAEHLAGLDLSDRAASLGFHLIGQAHDAGLLQIRPTNEQLAAYFHCSERTIQYAFRELESRGLGKRTGGRGGLNRPNERAAWSFNPCLPSLGCNTASASAPRSDATCTLVYIHEDPSTESDLAGERGGVVEPAREPAEAWECWEACEPEHGADELAELEKPNRSVFVEPTSAPAVEPEIPHRAECAEPLPVVELESNKLLPLSLETDQSEASYSPPEREPSGRSTYDRGVKPRDAYIRDGHAWRDALAGLRRIEVPASDDQAGLDLPESAPRSGARIADPQLRRTYYALIGKAKKAISISQAKALRNEAARILNGAEMLPPGSSSTAPDTPPLTSHSGNGAAAGDPLVERSSPARANTTTTRAAPRAGQAADQRQHAQQAVLWGAS